MAPSNSTQGKGYFTFSERMAGKCLFNGQTKPTPVEFRVSVIGEDLDRFKEEEEWARLEGTVDIGESALPVVNGRMRVFVPDEEHVFEWQMQYEMACVTSKGEKYTLVGHKIMSDRWGLCCPSACVQAYSDTTKLYTNIHRGGVNGEIIASGELYISLWDCTKMILSMRGPAANRFKAYFVGNLAHIYFRAFLPKPRVTFESPVMPIQRELKAPKYVDLVAKTADGEELPVKRWQGGNKGCIICTHGLTTSDLMYTVETIPQNFVETMTAQGYDVYTVSLRFGRLCNNKKSFDLDDVAQYDYPAVFDLVESVADPVALKGGIHVHGQCFGGMSFCMAVLGGHIAPNRVKSLICNQLGFHVKLSKGNHFKLTTGIPEIMELVGVKEYSPLRAPKRTWQDYVVDWVAAYIMPIPFTFRSDNVELSRVGILFNELWNNDMMNRKTVTRATPDSGAMDMQLLRHCVKQAKAGHAVDRKGKEIYLPNMHLLAQIPVTFQFGNKSGVFCQPAMEADLAMIKKVAAEYGFKAPDGKGELHQLVIAEGHGHMDSLVGKEAYKNAYPDLIAHLSKWNTVEDSAPATTDPVKNTVKNGVSAEGTRKK